MSDKKKLLRLTESIYSRPHLISESGFAAISHYLDNRNLGVLLMEPMDDPMDPDEEDDMKPMMDPQMQVGVLEVHGALTYKPIEGLCGAIGCSYQMLLDCAEDMIEEGVKLIVMDCDSGGGEGYGAFETANELRHMCDDAGVKLIAYNDGDMASACYALACVADEVISNPYAETGSIGVLIALMDVSKAMEMNGLKRIFISAGDSKIPFAEDGSFKPDFLASLQEKVDALYADFVNHVSNYTGLSAKAVRDTQAKMFTAQEALNLGLINKVMTRSEFTDYIATQIQGM